MAAVIGQLRSDIRVPFGVNLLWDAKASLAVAVGRLRELGLTKAPGISEAITWAGALTVFGDEAISVDAAERTLSVVVKYPEDEQAVREAGLASVVRHD